MKLNLLFMVIFIAGCATTNAYKDPVSADVAKLTIKTRETKARNVGVVSYKGNEYLESKGDVIGVLNSIALGISNTDHLTIKIEADQPFRFTVKSGDYAFINPITLKVTVCFPHVRFVPKKGGVYLAEHSSEPNCGIEIFELAPDGSKAGIVPVESLNSCLDPWLTAGALKPKFTCPDNFNYEPAKP